MLKSGLWQHCRNVACPMSAWVVYGMGVVFVLSEGKRVVLDGRITFHAGVGEVGKK